jgi:hypothetical protein
MHNVLFVLTHSGSDTATFSEALQTTNPNIRVSDTRFEYQSYDDLQYLRRTPHNGSAKAVWADVLRHNQSLSRFLLEYVDVIGYVSLTKESEQKLRKEYGERAGDYFTNRLMGIKDFVVRKNAKVLFEPGEPSEWLTKMADAYFPGEGSS